VSPESFMQTDPEAPPKLSVRLLYSGKIEFEDGGIQYLLRALELMVQHDTALTQIFEVHICGSGTQEQWTLDYLKRLHDVNIQYHGFLSDREYLSVLSQADVCLALQDPTGRYGDDKTPSKVYEYLGYGKMVIAADVGDLSVLPAEVITLCRPLNEQSLYHELIAIAKDVNRPDKQGNAAACYAREHFDYPVVGQQLSQFILDK
jgi:glycosyltransferase involved in cell wall biosynthesis